MRSDRSNGIGSSLAAIKEEAMDVPTINISDSAKIVSLNEDEQESVSFGQKVGRNWS
jgi:hypothetical protein